jgi:hypothetical protein
VRSGLAAVLLSFAAALAGTPAESRGAAAEQPLCDYDLVLLDPNARALEVAVACRRPVRGFRFTDDFPADWAGPFADENGNPLNRDGASWSPENGRISGARYRVDLDGMARRENDYNSAKRSGASVMVDLSGVIAVPIEDGAAGETALALRFRAPHGGDVASSLPLRDAAHHVLAREVDHAAALVLGTFERRPIAVPLPLSLSDGQSAAAARRPEGVIDLVVMDGPLAADTDELAAWVEATALANADLWRGFPVARSTVVILPTPGRANVPFGRVISTGGIMVLVLVGSEIEARGLYDEWVLVHEFIHLGTPQIRDTGVWLNEGLATYLEPIIRYRAGWRSAESVWEEWTGWMGRGVAPMTRGLSSGSPYWGGALFSLMADVELRKLTGGRMGLEHCLRLVLAEAGGVSNGARTMEALAVADRNSPAPVLTRLAEAHLAGAPVDLEALFASLGVRSSGGRIEFDDAAPLAEVRRWILDGGPGARIHPLPLPAEP